MDRFDVTNKIIFYIILERMVNFVLYGCPTISFINKAIHSYSFILLGVKYLVLL